MKGVVVIEVYIVFKKRYISDLWDNPQGFGKEVIEEIVSVRTNEDLAKEEVSNSIDNLGYTKKTVR